MVFSSFTSDKDVLITKDLVSIFYYSDGLREEVIQSTFEVDKNNCRLQFWRDPEMHVFWQLADALWLPPGHGGDEQLQMLLSEILDSRQRRIRINIWNDTNPRTFQDHCVTLDEDRFVWPHAGCWSNKQNQLYGGYINLGLHYAAFKGFGWLKREMIRQLCFSQFEIFETGNSFWFLVNQLWRDPISCMKLFHVNVCLLCLVWRKVSFFIMMIWNGSNGLIGMRLIIIF